MINFDAVEFSERHPEEVISFFWRLVYVVKLRGIFPDHSDLNTLFTYIHTYFRTLIIARKIPFFKIFMIFDKLFVFRAHLRETYFFRIFCHADVVQLPMEVTHWGYFTGWYWGKKKKKRPHRPHTDTVLKL